MRTVSQDRQKKQWICGQKNWQIQVSFPELLGGVSEETGEFYEDLTVNDNVPWPDKLLKTLSSRMEKYMLKEQDEVVKATEWFQWLSDKNIPEKGNLR